MSYKLNELIAYVSNPLTSPTDYSFVVVVGKMLVNRITKL